MPGNVYINEVPGQPTVDTDADFSICVVGFSSTSPVDAGKVTTPYSVPAAAASDLGAGDGVDCLTQAITVTPGNPAPPAASYYATPASTAGSYGSIVTSGVNGTATPTNHTAVTPLGTYEPWMQIVSGGVLGTDTLTAWASLNGGREKKFVSLGTSLNYDFPATDGWGVDGRAGFTLGSSSDTLSAGDVFYTTTKAPQWSDDDLYDAGDPDNIAGAFAAIAESSTLFGKIAISEPVTTSDFSTLTAGLNYGLSMGKRWSLICRFRDPNSGETDAEYILAFQAFVAQCLDSRITFLAGSCWVSDAFTGRVYNRTFMAPYLARLASFKAVPGQAGERLAQNAGWLERGPLEGASLKDFSGNTIGHDEAIRGGIVSDDGAPHGGGVALYYQRNPQRAGTYVDDGATVAYPVGVPGGIYTPQDRAVANALETLAVGVALGSIGGADVLSDDVPPLLDEDIRTGIESKIAKLIRDFYDKEIQNAADPNLVTINPAVTVNGPRVTISGRLNVRFFGYTRTIALEFSGTR